MQQGSEACIAGDLGQAQAYASLSQKSGRALFKIRKLLVPGGYFHSCHKMFIHQTWCSWILSLVMHGEFVGLHANAVPFPVHMYNAHVNKLVFLFVC